MTKSSTYKNTKIRTALSKPEGKESLKEKPSVFFLQIQITKIGASQSGAPIFRFPPIPRELAQTVGFEPTVLFSTIDFEGRVGKGKEGKLREDKGRWGKGCGGGICRGVLG